jgi:hypothetical protein
MLVLLSEKNATVTEEVETDEATNSMSNANQNNKKTNSSFDSESGGKTSSSVSATNGDSVIVHLCFVFVLVLFLMGKMDIL